MEQLSCKQVNQSGSRRKTQGRHKKFAGCGKIVFLIKEKQAQHDDQSNGKIITNKVHGSTLPSARRKKAPEPRFFRFMHILLSVTGCHALSGVRPYSFASQLFNCFAAYRLSADKQTVFRRSNNII